MLKIDGKKMANETKRKKKMPAFRMRHLSFARHLSRTDLGMHKIELWVA